MPRASASTNRSRSSGATPMSESRMASTSPRASAKPSRTASPLPLPGLLQQAHAALGVVGDRLADHRLGVVLRAALDEQELRARGRGRAAARTRGSMWPASFRQGMTTLTVGRGRAGKRCGEGRATSPYISESSSTHGQAAQVAVQRGRRAAARRAASRPGSRAGRPRSRRAASMLRTSSGGSQASAGGRGFRPGISASAQHRLPEAAVAVDEHARARRGTPTRGPRTRPARRSGRDHVDHQHDVEGAAQAWPAAAGRRRRPDGR